MVKLNTIWVLLSIAANLDWPLQQLDIKNIFWNEKLEEVYMTGNSKKGESMVCKLKKSSNGLKKSPRTWFNRFAQVVRLCFSETLEMKEK